MGKSKETLSPAGRYRKPKGNTLVPLGYSKRNTRLYYRLRVDGKYVIDGFFDFESELFYLTPKGKDFTSRDKEILNRELDKLGYSYSDNADDYFYNKWQESCKPFNYNKLNTWD